MNFGIPSPKREDMAAYIQSYYQGLKEIKKENYDYSALRSTIDDPETVPLESVDMFTDPHFQQERINNQYALDSVVVHFCLLRMRLNARKKSMSMWETPGFGKPSMTLSHQLKSRRCRNMWEMKIHSISRSDLRVWSMSSAKTGRR